MSNINIIQQLTSDLVALAHAVALGFIFGVEIDTCPTKQLGGCHVEMPKVPT